MKKKYIAPETHALSIETSVLAVSLEGGGVGRPDDRAESHQKDYQGGWDWEYEEGE